MIFAVAAIAFVLIAIIATLYLRSRIQIQPGEAVVLSGRQYTDVDSESGDRDTHWHRIVTEGTVYRLPIVERADTLSISEMSLDFEAKDLRDSQGQSGQLSAVVTCRIAGDRPFVDRAIVRFLGMEQGEIVPVVRAAIDARLRAAVSEIDFDDIRAWTVIESSLVSSITEDLGQLGVVVDRIVFRKAPGHGGKSTSTNGHLH